MDFLLQRCWHTSVLRENKDYIVSKTTYLDPWVERVAQLRMETGSLKIEKAWLERPGRPGNMAESREEIQGLRGVQAYLGNGLKIRQALRDVKDEMERFLINDSVIGVIQAETFLFKERGYDNAADYSRAWEKFYVGSCRYYSNLERVQNTWGGYIGLSAREDTLFDRFKNQQLYKDDKGYYLINASLIDSFHQVNTSLKLDDNMKVTAAHGQLLRVPDQVCRESTAQLANIEGILLAGMSKKDLAGLLGAGQGCVHLIDLVYDSIKTLELYIKKGNQ